MTEYTYGPWIAHNGDECPVPGDTMVQVHHWGKCYPDDATRTAINVIWWEKYSIPPPIRYRIATPIPVDVVGERAYYLAPQISTSLWLTRYNDAKQRIILPTVNDKLVSCKCGMCRVEDL